MARSYPGSYHLPGSRRRRNLLVAGGALIALVAVGAVLLSILNSQSRRESFDMPTATPTVTSTMGKPVQDGPIVFLVESVESVDVLSPGPPSLWMQVVTVRLTNIGTASQLVSPQDQRLANDEGREDPPDPVGLAKLNAEGVSPVLLQPGETATMSLPFNAAADSTARIVLRAAPNTPGVAVKLSARHAGSGSAPGP